MLCEIMDFFGLGKEFRGAGFFETENHKMVSRNLKAVVKAGHLVILSGIMGSGKTTIARRVRQELMKEGEVLVSTNLAVDKDRVTLNTLITALFADLVTQKNFKAPSSPEVRERKLREVIRRKGKAVVLFVDEAHDLHTKTLIGLKRLMEVVQEGGSLLSIVLIAHPKLKFDLRRSRMEEIGTRSTVIAMDGIKGSERSYLEWIVGQCAKPEVKITDIFTEEAISTLVGRLATPLQIEHYAWRALEEAHLIGQKPVTHEIIEDCLSKDLDSLETHLIRLGYSVKTLSDVIDARPAEIRAFLKGRISPERGQEIHQELLNFGIIAA